MTQVQSRQAWPLSPEIQEMRATRVRRLIHERNRRTEHFRAGMFSDPAWDVLLELYAFELSQQRIIVTQLGTMSHVPASTVSRWIAALECEGLVERKIDHLDSRKVFVALTRKGIFAMDGYFRGGPGEETQPPSKHSFQPRWQTSDPDLDPEEDGP